MDNIRAFIALELPEEIREQLHRIAETFADFGGVNVTHSENIHCTLAFMGEIDDTSVEKSKEIMSEILTSLQPMRFSIGGIGVFPNSGPIHIIWASLKPSVDTAIPTQSAPDSLASLQSALEKRLVAEKIMPPSRYPFVPHITLARVKYIKNHDAMQSELKKLSSFTIAPFEVSKIALKQSTLTPRGPDYTDIAVYSLRKHSYV